MGRRPKDVDVSSSEDGGIPKAKGKRSSRSRLRESSRKAKKNDEKKSRKADRKKFPNRPPCRSDNFTYLDEVLTSEASCRSDAKEGEVSPPVTSPPDRVLKAPTPSPMKQVTPSPATKKYVSLLDDEVVIENLSGETSSRRSPPQSTTEQLSEDICVCTCKCRDCRQVRKKNAKKKTKKEANKKKEEPEFDDEIPSEILTRVDKGRISPVSPVDPIDGEGIKMNSNSKILDRFYSHNAFHLDSVLSSMHAGDFRLYPVDGDVPLAKLKRHRQKNKFAIYYKTFHGRYRRYKITEAYIEEVYYFLECIDTEAPLFSCLYKLLKYYVDNRTYYSLQVQGFVRFPVGQVIKKGRFERHYCDMLKKH